MSSINWQALVFSSVDGLYSQLEKQAKDRFPADEALAETAFNEVLSKISAQGWHRLESTYQNKGSPEGFVVVVFKNALEDYARSRFGYLRPPESIKRQGGVWLDVYQRIVVEEQLETAVAELLSKQAKLSLEELQDIIRTVKIIGHKQRTGKRGLAEMVEDTELENRPGSLLNDPFERGFLQPLRERLIHFAATLLNKRTTPNTLSIDALSPEDIVMLRLIYCENKSISECARMLGRSDQQLRRRLKQVLRILRRELS